MPPRNPDPIPKESRGKGRPKKSRPVPASAGTPAVDLGSGSPKTPSRSSIRAASLEVWRRLDKAVNAALDKVESGKTELSPATITAVTNYFKAAAALADDIPEERDPFEKYGPLPTFDDEEDDGNDTYRDDPDEPLGRL
jgi:hypothetical protein